jgi:hypothetical protein
LVLTYIWSIIEVIKAWIRHTFILMLPNGLWSSHLVHRQMSSTWYRWLSTWTPSIALCSLGTAVEAQLLLWAEGTCIGGSPCAGAISFTAAATHRSISAVNFSSCSLSLFSNSCRRSSSSRSLLLLRLR